MSLSASVCSRLQHQHETIQELLNGFSEEQLKQRIHNDKWSAFEQVAHVVTYQQHTPAFDRYVANNDPLKRITHLAFLC
jgi:hypothetical protein